MLNKFKVKITILASLIVTTVCFFNNISFLKACYSIIFTIVIFYFLGSIAEFELKKYLVDKEVLKDDELQDENLLETQDENSSEQEPSENLINDTEGEQYFEDDNFFEEMNFENEEDTFNT